MFTDCYDAAVAPQLMHPPEILEQAVQARLRIMAEPGKSGSTLADEER
jgi:hypothetical protein